MRAKSAMIPRTNQWASFQNGASRRQRLSSPTNADIIRVGLKDIGLERSAIQRFGGEGENVFLIRTDVSRSELGNIGKTVKDSLEKNYGKDTVIVERVLYP